MRAVRKVRGLTLFEKDCHRTSTKLDSPYYGRRSCSAILKRIIFKTTVTETLNDG
jgi:hypothetical protein